MAKKKALSEAVRVAERMLVDENLDGGEAIAMINAFKMSANASGCLAVLRCMDRKGISAQTLHFNPAISALARGGDHDGALDLLAEMKMRGVTCSAFTYSAAISACAKAGLWERALGLLDEMERRGVQRNTVTYSAAISACAKAGQWEQALRLLGEMHLCQVPKSRAKWNSIHPTPLSTNDVGLASLLQEIFSLCRFLASLPWSLPHPPFAAPPVIAPHPPLRSYWRAGQAVPIRLTR